MHLHLKKRNILLPFVLLAFSTSFAVADTETTTLFIQSNPINANIIFDGKPLLQKTPALLINIENGEHSIGIRKDDYAPANLEINLETNETRIFKTELSRKTIITSFPEYKHSIIDTDTDIEMASSLHLNEGSYNFSKKDNSLYINPIYPKENLLTISTTLFLTALTTSIAIDLDKDGELFLPHSELLMVSGAVTSILALITNSRCYSRSSTGSTISPSRVVSAKTSAVFTRAFR